MRFVSSRNTAKFVRISPDNPAYFFQNPACVRQPPVSQLFHFVTCIIVKAECSPPANALECVLPPDQKVIAVNFHTCAEIVVPGVYVFRTLFRIMHGQKPRSSVFPHLVNTVKEVLCRLLCRFPVLNRLVFLLCDQSVQCIEPGTRFRDKHMACPYRPSVNIQESIRRLFSEPVFKCTAQAAENVIDHAAFINKRHNLCHVNSVFAE